MPLALGQVTYRPRSAHNVLKTIVEGNLDELETHWEERFRPAHGPLAPRVIDLFRRFLTCGDPHFGFLKLQCPRCETERLLPFSCKARGLCPSCGKKRALAWAEHMIEDVLPEVPYAPLTFTIPKILRPLFKFDHSLYGDLCRAAFAAIRKLFEARFPHLDKPRPAFVAAPQSFGSLLNFHPHSHGLSSLGVFDSQGNFHEDPEVDFAQAELLFREALFVLLRKKDKIDDERINLLRSWNHSGFSVHAERLIAPGNQAELESALEYMERPPVSLQRIQRLDTGLVVYRGKFHPGLNRDHQIVTELEFLAMIVPHIQLRYEHKARCYGAISTTLRRSFGWLPNKPTPTTGDPDGHTTGEPDGSSGPGPKQPEPDDRAVTPKRRGNWAHFIRKVWIEDPEECSRCGEKMQIVAAVASPAQDDMIKEILTRRGEWDPPWLGRDPPSRDPSRDHVSAEDPPERIVELDTDPDEIWPEDIWPGSTS